MPPANWKAKAPLSLPGPTFAAQARLPKLPVPELEQSLKKLKASLKPIAHSAEEYDAATAEVDNFAKGLGPKLQERLLKRHDESDHWLEEWWDNDAYLAYRDSVVVNVSYFCEYSTLCCSCGPDLTLGLDGFEDQPSHLPQTPESRAANLIRAAMLFRKKFKLGQVPPEGPKDDPFCMDTWRYAFSRIHPLSHSWFSWNVLLGGCSTAAVSPVLAGRTGA
jgi:carnitine O-acetyltransferase